MVPRNVSQFRCSPNFYNPVPVFPSTHVSRIPQSLCFPVPMFPSPCAPQSICFPVTIDVHSPYAPPVPMFPQLIHQSLCSPPLFHRSVFHSLYSLNMFPSPYVPPTSSPVPMFHKPIPQKCFPFLMFPKHVPQCLCSTVPMFHSPYVPPTSSPVPMFPTPIPQKCFPFPIFPTHDPQSLCSPVAHVLSSIRIVIIAPQNTRTGKHRDWGTCLGSIGTGEHRDWGISLGSIGNGNTYVEHMGNIFGENWDWKQFWGRSGVGNKRSRGA